MAGRAKVHSMPIGASPGRGRDGVHTRERILEEAADLIAARGYRETTMKAVAAAVGISEPAVYRHFDGKEQLLVAVFSETVARILRPVAQDTSMLAIEGIMRQLRLLMSSEQAVLRRLITEMYAAAAVEPKVAALAKAFVEEASALLMDELARTVREGDAATAINLFHARAAIHIFMTGLAHHEMLANDLLDNKEWAVFVERALRRLLSE